MKALVSLCGIIAGFPFLAHAGPRSFDTRVLGQFGTIDLAHVRAWSGDPKLSAEIKRELKRNGKAAEDVNCVGYRFPGSWAGLGGDRAPPFICHFGTRDLSVRWTVILTGPNGQRFWRASPKAMREAEDLIQTRPRWRWSIARDGATR